MVSASWHTFPSLKSDGLIEAALCRNGCLRFVKFPSLMSLIQLCGSPHSRIYAEYRTMRSL